MGKFFPSNKLAALLLIGLGLIFITAFLMLVSFGAKYRQKSGSDSLEAAQKLQEEKYDLRRIKLEKDGETIEVFQNGTLIKSDQKGRRQAILGYSKIRELLSSLTEASLKELSAQSGGGSDYTLTIETKTGAIYTIPFSPSNSDPADPLADLIDNLEDTAASVLDPSPLPTPFPTPPPPGGPSPTPAPTLTPAPSSSPLATPGPNPSPSGLPAYLTAEPFDCGDYVLVKPTVISDIICDPSP